MRGTSRRIRRSIRSIVVGSICLALVAGFASVSAAKTANHTFHSTGAEQTFTVPAGVTSLHVTAVLPGARLWARRYNGPGNGMDSASKVAVSPDGNSVFVTGESTGISSHGDYATVAYDAHTGAHLWTKRYNGTGNGDDDARAVVVSPDGSKVFVTGTSPGSSSGP